MADVALSRPARAWLTLERQSSRPWFLPGVAVFPLCDYVLPFLPNQILLAGLSMTLPRRWMVLAATFATTTAVGAVLISVAIQFLGPLLLDAMPGGAPDANSLASASRMVREDGLIALAGLAMLPSPPRVAVVACAVAGLSPIQIGLAVLAGRILPATIFAAVGAKAPWLLRRIDSVDRIAREVEGARQSAASLSPKCQGPLFGLSGDTPSD